MTDDLSVCVSMLLIQKHENIGGPISLVMTFSFISTEEKIH